MTDDWPYDDFDADGDQSGGCGELLSLVAVLCAAIAIGVWWRVVDTARGWFGR
jgi:hypothetical protein